MASNKSSRTNVRGSGLTSPMTEPAGSTSVPSYSDARNAIDNAALNNYITTHALSEISTPVIVKQFGVSVMIRRQLISSLLLMNILLSMDRFELVILERLIEFEALIYDFASDISQTQHIALLTPSECQSSITAHTTY